MVPASPCPILPADLPAILCVFQVNFYHDRTKIVLSRSAEGADLLTFVDHQCCSTTFLLGTLARQGWTLPLRERVQYALHLLHCL